MVVGSSPVAVTYNYKLRSCKHCSNEAFRKSLLNKLSKEVYVKNSKGLQRLFGINIDILSKDTPHKKNHAILKIFRFLLTDVILTFCEFLTIKSSFLLLLIQLLKYNRKMRLNYQTMQAFFFFIVVLAYCEVLEIVLIRDGHINKYQCGIAY